MAITMPIENGMIPDMKPSSSDESQKTKLQENKDMFMQLLVAEMQYQDPLEPTDNSQYIQQLYSMSQTESILSVQEDVEKMQTKSLVGKFVTITDSQTGDSVEGRVDSVVNEKDGTYVYINGEAYNANTISAVHDETYFTAVTQAQTFMSMIDRLPSADNLTVGSKSDVEAAVNLLGSFDANTLSYIKEDYLTKVKELANKMKSLLAGGQTQGSTSTDAETEVVVPDTPSEDEISKEDTDTQDNQETPVE